MRKLKEYESGMVREDKSDKIDYSLAMDGPMFERYAKHMTNGAKIHGARNWMCASGTRELMDFRAAAVRHLYQWLRGDFSEDHAAAVIFNLNGAELVKERLCALETQLKSPHSSPSSPQSSAPGSAEIIKKP